ncbi:MAG: YggS family pyridoxal phosphate-dependent enzyme [Flavobacteriales bacterium]|nr:YggS family pyridoxal phosphate-dependent enzyme [Flavobacteriales bacterium]
MIKYNLDKIHSEIDKYASLVVVSKNRSDEEFMEAYNCGERNFGENKVQEIVRKAGIMPSDVHWHMIGHLQKNKVKYIAPFITLIHSVDNTELLKEIDKQAGKNQRAIQVLLQVYIASEESKYGLSAEEMFKILKQTNEFPNVKITGLMGMATLTSDLNRIRSEFKILKDLFLKAQSEPNIHNTEFSTLSMGMSGDYQIAIEEGSTLVRIGSLIFE